MDEQALYLEADEDITSAIDRLRHAEAARVQIVTPKRSVMLQSVINLKLLKKAADDAGKEIVLVSGDAVVKSLAARLGLATAASVGAKAVVATPPPLPAALSDEIIEEQAPVAESEPAPAADAPVDADATAAASKLQKLGEAAKAALPAAPSMKRRDLTAVPAGDDGPDESARVPNFNRLQRRLLWVGGGVTAIAGYLIAMYFMTSATVTLYAAGSKADIDATVIVDPAGQTDPEEETLAGQAVSATNELSTTFAATGKKDVGTKAAGEMTIANSTGVEQKLIAGTRFAAPDGKIFRSGADVVVPAASLNSYGDKINGQASVHVTADAAGDAYNLGPAPYGIPALGNDRIRATGAQMSGGTTKTVNIVSREDIDKARDGLLQKDKAAGVRALQEKVGKDKRLIEASVRQGPSSLQSSPAAGEEAGGSVQLTLKADYRGVAVSESELEALLKAQAMSALGGNKQVYDAGLKDAKFEAEGEADESGRQEFRLKTRVSGGPKINTSDIATQSKGKKYGEAMEIAGGQAGVQRAEIAIQPTWARRMPKRDQNITVTLSVEGKSNP